ncbi:MAG: hypothetical protein ACOC5T_01630 [Elusimicrobiota bacterium]
MAKYIEIDKYIVRETEDNISCTCHWGSLHPNNFKEGKQICKHIKQYLKRRYKR